MRDSSKVPLRKVDDYTIQFEFSVSYPRATVLLLSMPASYPKHYLKKYHINYNPNADELAKKIASHGHIAVRYAKEAINRGLEISLDEGLALERRLARIVAKMEDAAERSRL